MNTIDKSMIIRTIFGLFMILGFLFLIYLGNGALFGLVILIGFGISLEIVNLFNNKSKIWVINFNVLFSIFIICYLHPLYPLLCKIYPRLNNFLPSSTFKFISYFIYCFLFIFSIIGLKIEILGKQLLMFCIIHIIPYFISKTTKVGILNILIGKYYLIMPAFLIISNDIGAYFTGKFFGRTKLFPLSPKKTVEGFIGGAISSAIVYITMSYFKLKYNLFPDKLDEIMKSSFIIPITLQKVKFLYIIGFMFFIGTSIVAPFMGFLASALKRYFKKKDFGMIIPEHGGVTDRFDCHLMAIWFTYYLLKAIRITDKMKVIPLSEFIVENFSPDEIQEIIKNISH